MYSNHTGKANRSANRRLASSDPALPKAKQIGAASARQQTNHTPKRAKRLNGLLGLSGDILYLLSMEL